MNIDGWKFSEEKSAREREGKKKRLVEKEVG